MRRAALALLLAPALMAQAPASPHAAQAQPVDVGKLLMDVARVKMDIKTGKSAVAFWLSPSVLEAILHAADPGRSAGGEDEKAVAVMKSLRDYQIFMVEREYMNGLGEQKNLTAEELRASSWLESEDGIRVKPVDSLPPTARDFVGAFKRGMESRSKGQHFELLVFPQADDKGHPMEKAGKPGKVNLLMGKVQGLEPLEMTWHYPLDAIVAPKECPKCHEVISASWLYCAYCGTPAAK